MKIEGVPFTVTTWAEVCPEEHRGDQGKRSRELLRQGTSGFKL